MNKVLSYLKYIGLFIILVLIITVIISLFSMLGINNTIINKIGVILTALSFFIISSLASHKSKEKGYILGIKLSIIFVISLCLLNFIIFKSNICLDRIIYYVILIISSILGGSFGKNVKFNFLARKK